MKNLMIGFLALWLLPVIGSAQYLDEPGKKSTTIIVLMEGENEAGAYRKAYNAIIDRGMKIENSDPVALSIATEYAPIIGTIASRESRYEVSVRKDGDTVYLRMKGTARGAYDITYEVTAQYKKEWAVLMELANELGGTVKYL